MKSDLGDTILWSASSFGRGRGTYQVYPYAHEAVIDFDSCWAGYFQIFVYDFCNCGGLK